MANEIVKQILLRFKGDSKPLEREIKNVEKMAASLQKTVQGGQSGTGPSQLSKTLDTYVKQSQKFGMTVNKDITKFQKTIQEVATKDLKVLQRQTDDLFRKSEDKLRKLRQAEQNVQQMEERGANARQIRKQQRKTVRYGRELGEATSAFESSAQQFNVAAQGTPQAPGLMQRMGPLAQLFGPAALMQMAINTPKALDAIQIEKRQNEALVASRPIQQRMAMYSGDLSMALLGKKGVVGAAQKDMEGTRTAGKWTTGLQLGLGGAGALGGLGALALGLGPAGWAAGAAIGGTIAAYQGYKRWTTNATEREAQEEYQNSLEQRSNALIDPKLYQYFKENAPRRAQFNQVMGYTSERTSNLVTRGLREGMLNPEETLSYAEQLRGVAGAEQAGNLAVGVGRANLRFGLTKGTAASALAAASKFGQGGGKEAEKALEDVFRRGIAGGLKDYGMREEFVKATSQMLQQYSGAISPDQLAKSMSDLLVGGKGGIRDIEGAAGAQEMEKSLFAGEGSPLESAIAQAGAINQLKKMGVPVTATNVDVLRSLTVEDIKGKSDKYLDFIKSVGREDNEETSGQMLTYARNVRRSVEAPYGDSGNILAQIEERKKSGKPLTEEEWRDYSVAMGKAIISGRTGYQGLGKKTLEAQKSQGAAFLLSQFDEDFLPEALRKKDLKAVTDPALMEEEERKKKDAAFKQELYSKSGAAKLEEDTQKSIGGAKNIDELIKGQEEANKKIERAGEETDLSKASGDAVAAMEAFSGALNRLAQKINNSGNMQTYGRPK